jgi:predicted metal-dependent peptidase
MNNNSIDWTPKTGPVTEEETKETLRRVSLVRVKLIDQCPFFGHLLLKLSPVVTRGVPMAGVTKDRKLLVNPDWGCATREGELATTLCHEVLHIALGCFERQGTRTLMGWSEQSGPVSIWNLAHDYAINLIIEEMVAHDQRLVPPSKWLPAGLVDHAYKGMSAEEIYDLIVKKMGKSPQKAQGQGKSGQGQPQKGQGQSGQGQSGQGQSGQGQPFGTIDVSSLGVHQGTADIQQGQSGQGQGDDADADASGTNGVPDQHYWSVALVEAMQVHEAADHKRRGVIAGGIKKLIKEILEPRVSWVDALSRWVGENGRRADFTYRRPSRRSESIGETLPSLQKHGVDDIVVLWDTSGSMNGREKDIFAEIIGICQDLSMKLRVICVDTKIHSDQSDVEDPEDVDVKGGGGSDFTPAFDLLHDEGYQGVVVAFTDGYIGVPQTKPPHLRDCLWVIWEGDVDPTQGAWGAVLNVDKDGYEKR